MDDQPPETKAFGLQDNQKTILIVGAMIILIIIALVFILDGTGVFSFTSGNLAEVGVLHDESELATIDGAATVQQSADASGGAYVDFGLAESTPTPQPIPAPTTFFQPRAPFYSTFIYLWYKTPADGEWSYWTDHGNNPPSTWFSHYIPDPNPTIFDPATELYSSQSYETFKWQAQKLAEAKIEVAIGSWWGQNRKEDSALQKILGDYMSRLDNPYPNLRWSIYYEKEGFNDESVATLTSELRYIKDKFTTSPYYLKVDNKPVVFVYAGSNDTPGSMTQRWSQANAAVGNAFYVVLKVFPGYITDQYQPSSWHQYAPAVRSGSHAPHSFFVSPGFWLDDGSGVRLARDASAFENAVKKMVTANATWKLVETWNEWGEGTSVEPGKQVMLSNGKEIIDPNGMTFGNTYINILNRNLPALENGTGRI